MTNTHYKYTKRMNRNKMSNCTNIYHNHTVNIIACVPCNNNNNNCTRMSGNDVDY